MKSPFFLLIFTVLVLSYMSHIDEVYDSTAFVLKILNVSRLYISLYFSLEMISTADYSFKVNLSNTLHLMKKKKIKGSTLNLRKFKIVLLFWGD